MRKEERDVATVGIPSHGLGEMAAFWGRCHNKARFSSRHLVLRYLWLPALGISATLKCSRFVLILVSRRVPIRAGFVPI